MCFPLNRYFDALQEIAAVRVAEANGEVMPDWVPFSDFEVCQLCKSDFSWASTSRSEVRDVSRGCQFGGTNRAGLRP